MMTAALVSIISRVIKSQQFFLYNSITFISISITSIPVPATHIPTTNISNNQLDCQHFFRQIFLGYFSDIVQAFDTLRKNVCGDDYTSLHNPIVLSSVLPAYGMFHSIQILFL